MTSSVRLASDLESAQSAPPAARVLVPLNRRPPDSELGLGPLDGAVLVRLVPTEAGHLHPGVLGLWSPHLMIACSRPT